MADQVKNALVFMRISLRGGTTPTAETKPDRFMTWIALTTAIMAVFAVVATLCIRVAVLLPGCGSAFLLKNQGREERNERQLGRNAEMNPLV